MTQQNHYGQQSEQLVISDNELCQKGKPFSEGFVFIDLRPEFSIGELPSLAIILEA